MRHSSAFTLVEVLITIALFAALIFGGAQLYMVYGRTITLQKSTINASLGGSNIIDAVRAAAFPAVHVVAAHTFSGENYTSGVTTAVFELPSFDSSGAIIPGTYDYVGISASGTDAVRLIDAAPGSSRVSGEKKLTSVLEALSFSYDDPSFPLVTNVTVDATTTSTVRGQTTKMHMREHIYLRNI